MHWNIDSSWICFPRGPEDDLITAETCRPEIRIDSSWACFPRGSEDDLIKFETCRPDNVLFLLYIKYSVLLLTDTLYLYAITLRGGKHELDRSGLHFRTHSRATGNKGVLLATA
jgi:hypothetical protein